jgi:hypothetical protein
MKSHRRLGFFFAFACAFALFSASATLSHAATIVSETFDGYTSFPDFNPGDPTNLGVPLTVEGADSSLWMGARVGGNGSGSVATDVGVQQNFEPPGGLMRTPAGRYAEDAGLVLRVDLTAYENVNIEFDWRMHNALQTHRNKFAYHVGDGLGTPNNTYDWFSDPAFANGNPAWYGANFTELLSVNRTFGGTQADGSVRHESLSIPGGDVLYLVWWYDVPPGTTGTRLGKIDNVVITGDLIIPEPGTCVLLALGAASLASLGFRRRGY